jgi:hypothetical protein
MKQIADIEGKIVSLKETIWDKFGNISETKPPFSTIPARLGWLQGWMATQDARFTAKIL